MLLVVLTGFILNTTWNASKSVLGYATSTSPVTLLQETNIQRSQNGKNVLALNSQLSQAAQAKANDMANRDYWSHTTPDGKQPWQFISDAGYTYITAGENLAYGFDTSAYTVSGWMNSPAHKENLLNSEYMEVGFGIANAANYQGTGEETIVVAMYAKPQKVVTPNSAQTGRAPETPITQRSTPSETTPTAQQPEAPVANSDEPEEIAQAPITNPEPTAQTLQAKEVARIDVLTNGNAQWAALAASVLATVAIIAFVIKHAKLWRRYIVRGEDFIIRHPVLDTLILSVGVLGFLLTRTTGFIH